MTRYRLVLLCITFLLTTTSISSAISTDTSNLQQDTLADEVPTWAIGTQWTYIVNEFHINYSGMIFDMNMQEFTMKVVSADQGTYTVEFKGRLDGGFNIPDMLSIDFAYTFLKGTMILKQSDLAIVRIDDIGVYGLYFVQQNFFVESPILQMRLPVFLRIYTDIEYEPVRAFIPFPLEEGDMGIINSTEMYVNNISSPLLGFISRFSNALFYSRLSIFIASISPDWANILSAVETRFPEGIPQGFSLNQPISTFDRPYHLVLEDIEVPAGSYSAYNLMGNESFGQIYYSPELGWIPKMNFEFSAPFPSAGSIDVRIDMELSSTKSLSL